MTSLMLRGAACLGRCRWQSPCQQAQVCRHLSNKGFIAGLLDRVRDELQKDKDMKESLKKFREERKKLEQSDELQKVREYYKSIEQDERLKGTADKMKEGFESMRASVSQQEYLQKAAKGVNEAASKMGEQLSKSAEILSESDLMRKAKTGMESISREIEGDLSLRVYRSPTVLMTRQEVAGISDETFNKVYEANETEQGVVLHKDSRWTQAWSNFKDSNPYMQKLFDMKSQYEESENPLARGGRFVAQRFSSLFGSIFTDADFHKVLGEVTKLEPSFNLPNFAAYCRQFVIPNVLEGIYRGDLRVLESWCYEAQYKRLEHQVKTLKQHKYKSESRVLDLSFPEFVQAKAFDQGPVLVMTFTAQHIECVRDANGKVVEGDPDKILRVTHVWAVCRDLSELNPKAAWRVIEIHCMPTEQWI